MRLATLLAAVDGATVRGNADLEVGEVRDDSRKVEPGDLFVATPGTKVDARAFIDQAVARGAAAVVCEAPAPTGFAGTVVTVPSARRALGVIAANRHGAARALDLLAVTGTNGKTTTTYLLEAILAAAGRTVGVVGTVGYRWPGHFREAALTTPGALDLHAMLADMRADGVGTVVMEASSHALDQGRLDGCRYQVVGLTNVTQDHLDYHGTMARYFDAKAILCERLVRAGGTAVAFADRDDGARWLARARAAGQATLAIAVDAGAGASTPVSTTAGGGPASSATRADVTVGRRELSADGVRADLATPWGALAIRSALVGEYNLRNLVLAATMAGAAGVAPDAIVRGLGAMRGVPGRLEGVANDRGVLCVVDYAHTPDALERAIGALRPLTRGRLIVVFGCGGDRDRGKRPLMGKVAARDADVAVVTSDNPRTEDPAAIVAMIAEGVVAADSPALRAADLGRAARGHLVEVDRRAAIGHAVAAARAGDVVLIAGKGHEDYQILGTTKIHFDDREEAARAFASGGSR